MIILTSSRFIYYYRRYHGLESFSTKLLTYCGLNIVKHKDIIDDLSTKEMIIRTEEPWGNKMIIKYKLSEKGYNILKQILEPYESLFPRIETEKTR